MKLKLCVLTALSLAGLALSAAPSSAGWLCHHCGCNCYSTVITCRPYNAFTPVCCGSLVCDGCCPFGSPNLPSGVACSPMMGNPLLGMNHDMAAFNSVYQQPMMVPAPAGALPAQPMPTNLQTQAPMGYPLQPTGYQQGYYPMYYPMVPQQQFPGYGR
jgi:hypothetical protein